MKRLYNLILACLFMVSLSACGKQAGADSSADKVMEQHGQTERAGTTEQTEQEQPAVSEAEQTEAQTENILTDREEQKIEGGDNTVMGDISFNFETKTVLLNSGYEMPIYGIGTYSLTGDTCVESVTAALNSGVRLIDTAYMYHNEEAVGRTVRRSGIPREELFITTKLWVQDAGYEKTKKAFEVSLSNLQLDYLDLYLIHRPFGDYYGAWRAMEELYEAGKIRAIGLSNFGSDRLVDLVMNNKVVPAVNQVECHPFFQQKAAFEFMKEYQIQPEAWAPFAEGQKNLFSNEVLSGIGAKYGKSAAQVVLRWNYQRGVVTIPKSVHKERMEQNISIFDFALTEEEMERIGTLDEGSTLFGSNEDPKYAKMINSVKLHQE